jgi:hypothetical protein
MVLCRLFLMFSILLAAPSFLAAQNLDTAKIDQALGRTGQESGDVYRVSFPRTDLHVRVNELNIQPGLALGSWAAFSGSDAHAQVMGDLVLLQNEVNAVIRKLRSASIDVTAVHNHLINETPHVLYVHYMGHGKAADLAASLRAALAQSKTPREAPAPPPPAAEEPGFVKTIDDVLGVKGKWSGTVLSFGIMRSGPITDEGATLTGPQGLAESINFQDAGSGRVATTGDFVLTAEEVNPVISALAAHEIEITALHSHLLTEQPRLFFMHFWGLGAPASVAGGIKAALEKIPVK